MLRAICILVDIFIKKKLTTKISFVGCFFYKKKRARPDKALLP